MSAPTTARGTKRVRDGVTCVEFARTFDAPIRDVWAAVTQSDRLARWVGTWDGEPSLGEVQFQMLYEGDDVPAETFSIDACDAPRLLRITSTAISGDGVQVWKLRLDLTEVEDVTTLTFCQDVPDPSLAEGVGPGWHYYLDRLVIAETGGDPAQVEWADYYPALCEHYRAEFG